MSKILGIVIVLSVALGLIGYFIYPRFFPRSEVDRVSSHIENSQRGEGGKEQLQTEESYYTCPMHPTVRSDKPGACPICGMTLVKKVVKSRAVSKQQVEGISITATQGILANVATTTAMKRSLTKKIVAVGNVDYAEPNVRTISTRFAGRLERLYLTFTGQKVQKGDPVAVLYSPEAISAQQEYLLAKDSYEQVKESPEIISNGAKSLLQESKNKLMLWGFTPQQITSLDSTRTVSNDVPIYSPINGTVIKKNVEAQQYVGAGEDIYELVDLSSVWVLADIYESELRSVHEGNSIIVTSDAYPGDSYEGKVKYIDSKVDPETRTVRVRAELPNPRENLKPGMFVSVSLESVLPSAIVVPLSAVLYKGTRTAVWLKVGDGRFSPRIVQLGMKSGDYVQVLDGISEEDVVVSSGGYLLDSESQLQLPVGSN